ncbi:hypothetical protein DVH05_001316 [Phytophthora capsici]|nr:hypothetical protein DVH05_001316 [Phytophthora capsici]
MPKRKEREYPFRHSIAELFDQSDHAEAAISLRQTFGFGTDRLFRFAKALRILIFDAADHRARNLRHRLPEHLIVPLLATSDALTELTEAITQEVHRLKRLEVSYKKRRFE